MKDVTAFVARLEEALELVEAARAQLNEEHANCSCCGVQVWADRDEGKWGEMLAGVENRLTRVIGSAESKRA